MARIVIAEKSFAFPSELRKGYAPRRQCFLPFSARPIQKSHSQKPILAKIVAMDIIQKIEKEQMKKEPTPFNVGDTVKVHVRVVEGGKERIQLFAGIVIGKRGTGVNAAFTVRKIASGEGVERGFPVHSPKVAEIEVIKRGKVRRARLNYLRDRVGKRATTVREEVFSAEDAKAKKAAKKANAKAAAEAEEAQKAAAAAAEAAKAAEAAAAEAAAAEAAPVEEAAPAPEAGGEEKA
ncbi:MAG: large subunit ribosomal protein L19 [Pseudoalteromonas tetraodonis]